MGPVLNGYRSFHSALTLQNETCDPEVVKTGPGKQKNGYAYYEIAIMKDYSKHTNCF